MAKTTEKYELMYIINPNLSEEETAAVVEKFKALVEQNGTLEEMEEMGKRKLAYEINYISEGYYVLVTYGSEQALGTMVALSLVRELGPAVTALLFAGRAGTALTAEIGLMRAGEQLAAMEMMGVDPVRRVLAPRFIGAFVAMPVLATIFSAVGIMGAWFVGVEMIGTDGGAFWSQMQSAVDVWHDIGNGFIKSVVFGVAVALVALFNGYAARPTPEGVSRATTSTVVVASLLVLGLDFIMTAWMFTTV